MSTIKRTDAVFEPTISIRSNAEMIAATTKDQADFFAIDPRTLLGYITIALRLSEDGDGVIATVHSGGDNRARKAMLLSLIDHVKGAQDQHDAERADEEQQNDPN